MSSWLAASDAATRPVDQFEQCPPGDSSAPVVLPGGDRYGRSDDLPRACNGDRYDPQKDVLTRGFRFDFQLPAMEVTRSRSQATTLAVISDDRGHPLGRQDPGGGASCPRTSRCVTFRVCALRAWPRSRVSPLRAGETHDRPGPGLLTSAVLSRSAVVQGPAGGHLRGGPRPTAVRAAAA